MGPRRFERPTSSLSGTRSNQLSYEPYRRHPPAIDRRGIVKTVVFLSILSNMLPRFALLCMSQDDLLRFRPCRYRKAMWMIYSRRMIRLQTQMG
jgi:hypothetical protein